MKNILVFTLIIFSFIQVSFGQYDPKALEILDAMSKKYKEMSSFKAEFTFILNNPQAKVNETQKGIIDVKASKYKLKLGNQEIYNNGTTVWTYLKSANEVNITDYEPEEDDITPTKIYTLYKKGYKYRITGTETIGNVKYDVIELNPEDRNNKFFKIKILVSQADKSVKSWVIYEKNGNTYTYKVDKFTANTNLQDNYFNFDKTKYPGVKEIDLR